MSVKCELKAVQSLADFYEQIAIGLMLPSHFGRNLDALQDCLSNDVAGPVEVFWFNASTARQDLGEDTFESLADVLRGVMAERDDFQVWLGLD